MDKLLKTAKPWKTARSNEDLSRSQYSLVSTDLTEEAVQVWLGLPDQVKYDPSLEKFRLRYEKEQGEIDNFQENPKNGSSATKRLPDVNSATYIGDKDDLTIINGARNGAEEKQEQRPDDVRIPNKKSKVAQARQTVKLTILVGVWIFFTIVFLMYNEKEEITRHSTVAPGEIKNFILLNSGHKLSILLKLTGPFLSEPYEKKLKENEKENMTKMVVWIETWIDNNGEKKALPSSPQWTIYLEDQTQDFHLTETRSAVLHLETTVSRLLAVRIQSTASITTPFTMSYTLDPLDGATGIIYACILLCALYALIVFEVINRTMAALLLSTTSIAVLSLVGERPSLPELVSWLDVETLLLLFSMMVLVAILAETGVFDYFAVLTFQLARGKIWPLITLLCVITAIVSLLLDNVTTVLLMTPVTIRLCEVMGLNPVPVLISMVLFCNLGGTATPVGDPPNVIIASNKQVVQAGINFTNFTFHMTFGIILVAIQTYIQIRFIFRDTNTLRLNESKDIQDLRNEISVWRRAADSLPHLSNDQSIVKERIERKANRLAAKLEVLVKEAKTRACPKACYESTLADMRQKYKIKDKWLLVKCSVTIAFVVIAFFLHSLPQFNRVSLGWTALLGSLLLLTLADREDLEPILHRIEWSTLLFFAALFVLMEALAKLGLIGYIGGWTEALILRVDESDRLAVALVLMIWVSGITSAFVDNVPLTTMMVRVVTSLGSHPTLNLPMAPLIWALSYGVCLGGNGTLIGASSNVVCVGIAENHGYRISFMQFFKIGFPVMIGHLVIATAYLLVCHCVFTWH
ncbi:P protein-like isoform X1 [Trichoplusia ni]|uniref:P protein-like isoform X1 n=1 Tax=Trichoplusia ni TaxID=7111 RepID=A0A7E5W2S5_TRINI|nr:P protein-like isoform X1 [Trichoplusia ni]XP_026734586.1 P protein-like isoform X1 [Trichoplusia ni]